MKYLLSFCSGFLNSFHDEIERYKRIVTVMEYAFNPHQEKWERGERTPESSARAYLTVIASNPVAVINALHKTS